MFSPVPSPLCSSSDYGNHRIVALRASDLEFLFSFGTYGSGDGQLSNPRFICTSGDLVICADKGNKRVQTFHATDGAHVRTSHTLPGSPNGICASRSGEWLCVSDSDLHLVHVLRAADLKLVRSIGTKGSDPAQFKYPRGLSFSDDDVLLYCCDGGNHRVQVSYSRAPYLLFFRHHELQQLLHAGASLQ